MEGMFNKVNLSTVTVPVQKEVEELEKLLLSENNTLNLLSAEEYEEIDPNLLRYFAWKHGVYQFPTKQLISFLEGFISISSFGTPAIEIAAGMGNIGKWLNIPMTDNRLHERPEVIEKYKLFDQPTCKYSKEVENIDGNSAVLKYRPTVVIGAWVTESPRNPYGVNEVEMMKHVPLYVLIGNETTHGDKPVLKTCKNVKYHANWLITRSVAPEKNCMYIIEGYK